MATALPFHRAVVTDPAFAPTEGPFTVHTRWIETEFVNDIKAFNAVAGEDPEAEEGRESLVVEVGGRRLEVSLPASLGTTFTRGAATAGGGTATKVKRRGNKSVKTASGDTLASPMQGTIVKIAVEEGQQVNEGDLIVVLEAMKMEQPLNAHRSGTIVGLKAEVGASLTSGATICEIKA
ncbi:acetyl-CoA carboxylase biotin carboxyl carrier protein subunit, partial [Streptomyces sp. H27-H5]|uniref:acetyl-CoA carboxylase biotin carboxyl carrier protein subunit n=1 Tax=Streptomyces sp. H27-H5 TaxID=2996460 RepID=UPI002271BB6B